MNFVVNFIKDILMIKSEDSCVGLSGIKVKKNAKSKQIVKSVKKSEQRLSDLMRKNNKKAKKEVLN